MMKDKNRGFSLVELLVVIMIFSVAITGMIKLFIYTGVLADASGNKTLAVSEAQDKIEEIRNYTYDNIDTDYGSAGTPGDTFDLTSLNGKGFIYIDEVFSGNDEVLRIEVVVCWEDKYGRIIGEDTNLNGVLVSAEDINSNNKVDSEVEIVSMITRR